MHLIGISRTDASEAYEDPWGVKFAVRDVTAAGLTVECRCEDTAEEVTDTLQTGAEYSEEAEKLAVSFRPEGKDGWVHMQYLKWFGICGTGMRSEEYGEGFMAIYGDDPFWTYISYPASEGCFVAMTQQVRDWWGEYESGVMELVDSARFTDPE